MSYQAASATGPQIGLLLLGDRSLFDAYFTNFLIQLHLKANVLELTTFAAATEALSGTSAFSPSIILAMDGSLAKAEAASLLTQATHFVSRGGTIIFAGPFSSYASAGESKNLFTSFGLQWEYGEKIHTTHYLNSAAGEHITMTGLAASYSQNAMLLRHVANENAIYLPTLDSRMESMVSAPSSVGKVIQTIEPVRDLTQTPAAWASAGKGKIGYVGDVGTERQTAAVVFAMCGLKL